MNVEYGTACATSASGVHNLGGGVRGVRKSGVRVSPLAREWGARPERTERMLPDVAGGRRTPSERMPPEGRGRSGDGVRGRLRWRRRPWPPVAGSRTAES